MVIRTWFSCRKQANCQRPHKPSDQQSDNKNQQHLFYLFKNLFYHRFDPRKYTFRICRVRYARYFGKNTASNFNANYAVHYR